MPLPIRKSDPIRHESSEACGAVVTVLNADGWRVIECRDAIQWILQRRTVRTSGVVEFRSRKFCRVKRVLIRESKVATFDRIDPGARSILERLPDRIGGASSGVGGLIAPSERSIVPTDATPVLRSAIDTVRLDLWAIGGGRYAVTLGDAVLVPSSRDPEHDACRALVARGITGRAETRSHNGTAPRMIIPSIEVMAGFEVVEGNLGPHRRKCSAGTSRGVEDGDDADGGTDIAADPDSVHTGDRSEGDAP